MESQKYSALYRGHTSVSSGYSRHVIPWLVKEVDRQSRAEQVTLQLVGGALVVAAPSGSVVASHPVLQLSHFSQTVADPRCFLYLVKAGHGSHSMYLYQLRDKDMVTELFNTIREHSRRTQQTQRSQSDASALNMAQLRRACTANGVPPPAPLSTPSLSQPSSLNPHTASYFEVQYVCKIKTSHRKGPPSFIDDALHQFHELKRRVAPLSGSSHHPTGTPDDPDYLQGEHSVRCGSTDSVNSVGSNTGGSLAATLAAETRSVGGGEAADARATTPGGCELAEDAARGIGPPGVDASAPMAVPKIQQTPATPQSTPCERHLSTVAESAEPDGVSVTAVDGNVASIPRSASTDGETTALEHAPHTFRTRAMSGDTARMARRTVPDDTTRARAGSVGSSLQRPRLGSMDHNYTMLFQVGKLELQLISPDNKAVKLHKYFRDVSQITQGQKNSDHFGFICREAPTLTSEPAHAQKSAYVGYIFRCQNEKIAEDVISTLTTVFRSAYDVLRAGRRHQQQHCDFCPASWYNRLCVELDGLSVEAAQAVIVRALDCLPAEDRRELLVKLSGAEVTELAEQSELLMSLLRFLCDEKQSHHTHVPAGQQPSGHDSYNLVLDLSSGLNKAKRSLTSRLEQVWKYNRGREDAPSQPDPLVLQQSSGATTPENSPCPTPTKAEFKYDYSSDTPVSARPRSSTIAGSSGEGYRREYRTRKQLQSPQSTDSPMVAIFKRMGTGADTSPSRHSSASWRQAIFNRIRTPGEKSPLVSRPPPVEKPPRRTPEQLRQLWKKAIHQQVLINRMQREDERITERVRSGERVMYAEMPACDWNVASDWQQLIGSVRAGGKLHGDDLHDLVLRGVPLRMRAEVWQLLALHHRQTHPAPSVDHVENYQTGYPQLIKQLTSFQREILTDLGRTFPHHPYFRSPFGSGQLELFNVLKAVSLLDPELGYCQGMGFIAGILLLHMPEEEAYEMLKHLLFSRELRKQFMPDMSPLQGQMYQFSRLVHDHDCSLYTHLERFEVSPMLYATPWFLTLFSSQYPIGFCARVFDLVLLLGLEAVFQVALALLTAHHDALIALEGMEDIMDFIKTEMPRLSHADADAVFKKALSLDISRQLLSYEVEYQVLQEEVLASPAHADSDLNKLGTLNQTLKRQVMDLLQQLQTTSDQLKTAQERNKELELRTSQLESQRSDLITFVRYLSLHTPDRLQIPAPFRRYLTDGDVTASADDVTVPRDPLNCAVFDSGPAARPRRDRQLATRSSSADGE